LSSRPSQLPENSLRALPGLLAVFPDLPRCRSGSIHLTLKIRHLSAKPNNNRTISSHKTLLKVRPRGHNGFMRNVGPAQIAILLITAAVIISALAGLAYVITRVVKKAWAKDDRADV